MATLGDFLEAVYRPVEPFRTVRAVVRQRLDRVAVHRATAVTEPPTGRRRAVAETPPPDPVEHILRVWVGGPGRVRAEEVGRAGLLVVGGGKWWRRDARGRVEAGETERRGRRPPDLTDVDRHFSPAALRQYFAGLSLAAVGSVRTAGRDCLRLRAVPQPGALLWPHWLGFGADEYELHADPERGVLLAVVARAGGELLSENVVAEVAFDELLADDLFAYAPGPGEVVRPAVPRVERLTLEAAASRLPFTVLAPTRVPPGADGREVDVITHTPDTDEAAYLTLMYFGGGYFVLHQRPAPAPLDEWEWEAVERAGRRLAVTDPGPGAGRRGVRLEHLGTHVDIWADLDRETLLDVAASLEPVRGSG